MPKPLGIGIGLRGNNLVMGVTRSAPFEDRIYDAVEEAIADGLTVAQFIGIVREAWGSTLRDHQRYADRELAKAQEAARRGAE